MEIELKLALDALAVPALRAHPLLAHYSLRPGRTRMVENRYFDTPQLTLWRQGIELRLRRDGRRHLQTLKRLPGASTSRSEGGLHRLDEWETPRRGTEPELATLLSTLPEQAAQVAQAVRDAAAEGALGVRLSTHYKRTSWLLRSAQGDLVEVALDIGEVRAAGRAVPLCELEFELKQGTERALFELASALHASVPLRPQWRGKAERGFVMLAALPAPAPRGARPVRLARRTPVAAALRALAEECLAHAQDNEAGVLGSSEAEYVHQMRVGLRRLRAALGLFKSVAPAPQPVLEGLRWSAAQLGAARDAEVLAHETLARIPAPTAAEAPSWGALAAAAASAAGEARRAAVEALRSPRHAAWQWALRAWTAGLEEGSDVLAQSVAEHAERRLRRLRRRLVQQGRDLAAGDSEARHALRITAKKLRYASEMLGAAFPAGRRPRGLRALAALQEQLGRLNDGDVAAAALAGLLARDPQLAPAVAYAQGWLAADGANRLSRLGAIWKKVRRQL